MANFSLTDLTNAFSEALKPYFGGNSRPAAGAAAPSSQGNSVMAALSEAAGGVTDKFVKLLNAATPLGTAFLGLSAQGKEAAAAMEFIAGVVNKVNPQIGGALTGFVKTMEAGRESINQASRQGIGGTNLPEFMAQTRAAGFEMAEYGKLLKAQGPSITGLGATAQEGSQRFLKLTRDAIESDIGQQVVQFQGNVDGLQSATAIMASNTKVNLQTDLKGRAELAQASAYLAQTIDEQARATGKSRDAIEAELKERMKSPEAILAMNMMSEQQRQQFVKTQASLSGMGPSINNLAQTIASGGRMTKDNLNTMAALGPAGVEFQRAVRMQQSAVTDAQKMQADAAMKAAVAKINEFQSSERYARLALQGEGEIAQTQRRLIAENQRRAGAETQAREAGVDPAQALRLQEDRIRREQQGQIGVGPDAGKVDTNQAATRLLNTAQEEARKNTAALTDQFSKLNTTLGKSPEFVNTTRQGIETLFGGKIGGTVEQKSNELSKTPDKLKEALGIDSTSGRSTNAPTINPNTPFATGRPTNREIGSKAATGNWFEDFGLGTMMQLHKKEAVVPFDKRFDFVKDIVSEANAGKPGQAQSQGQFNFASIQDMMQKNLAQISSKEFKLPEMPKIEMPQAPSMPQMPEIKMPSMNLGGMLDNLKTTISTAATPQRQQAAKPEPEQEMGAGKPAAETTASEITAGPKEDIQLQTLDGINLLNKTMGQMLSYMSDISEASSKTARLAGKATGNRALA